MNNKSKWDSLTLKEKSDIMKMAISSGVMDLNNIRNSYNSFAEGGPTEETNYQGDILGIPVPQGVETAASFVPILGTLMDAKEFIEDPSWENAGYLGLSLVAEIPFLKGLKAAKAAKAAKVMDKYDDAVKAYNKAEAKVKRMENTPNLNYKKINQARQDLFKAYSDMHNLYPEFRGPVHEALNVVDNIGDFQKVVDPLLLGMDAVANYSQLTKE
jgi:hypothetical protein